MTVLVVAPHGMDEVLGCGGTIARLAASGRRIETLVLFGDGTGLDAQRRAAGPAAAARLGSSAPRYAGFPENRSDTIPLVEIVSVVERSITEFQASELYVSHGGNLNIDHQAAFRATVTAARPVPRSPVRSIYAYEVLSSTDWAPPSVLAFQPTRFVDITATLDAKLEALAHYAGDLRPSPHSRSVEGVRALAQHRGMTVGFTAAEAFAVVRELI